MSAELLRQAAALMRERAGAARPGPYVAEATPEMWTNPIVCGPEYPAEVEGRTHRFVIAECHGFSKPQNAEHIASWHPAVALAVADLLDLTAEDYAPYWYESYAAPFVPVIEKAYQVAHAYLGEQS